MQRSAIPLLAILAVALVAALIGGVTGAALYASSDDSDEPAAQPQVRADDTTPAAIQTGSVGAVYERANAGVVEITVAAERDDSGLAPEGDRRSLGSGWIYDREGHVITNQHVVSDADDVAVTFSNGESYDARVVGTDPSTDIAVIRVLDAPAELLRPLPVGDSTALEVGDAVVAIGSPFGLEGTVTAGIVSALNRQMQAPNDFTINDSIQTDAAINHGNSGGPLLNMEAEVVGVNAQIRTDGGGNEGVGFAIPSATVETIVPQLIDDGEVRHAYLGVSVVAIPTTAADDLDVPAGVAVAAVREGSPAADAELRAGSDSREVNGTSYPTGGDVITAVDGEPVRTTDELQQAIDAKQPGQTVRLTVARGGDTRTVEVELTERPESVTP